MKYIIATIFQLAVLFGLRHFTKEHPFDMVSYTLGVIVSASYTFIITLFDTSPFKK